MGITRFGISGPKSRSVNICLQRSDFGLLGLILKKNEVTSKIPAPPSAPQTASDHLAPAPIPWQLLGIIMSPRPPALELGREVGRNPFVGSGGAMHTSTTVPGLPEDET